MVRDGQSRREKARRAIRLAWDRIEVPPTNLNPRCPIAVRAVQEQEIGE